MNGLSENMGFPVRATSRSNYSDDWDDTWAMIRWRGAVASAIRGKRGQTFLRELIAALGAVPEPRLISGHFQLRPLDAASLEIDSGVCALGAVGLARGLDMGGLDPEEDPEEIARFFGLREALAAEVLYENDEYPRTETPEQRFQRVRTWAMANLLQPVAQA